MKTIGLLGGMSWESSLEYYRIINEEIKRILGGAHSAKSIMYSFNFEEIEDLQHSGKWDILKDEMIFQADNLKKAGADFIVICTNTMHIFADDIERETGLKVIHIADSTARAIKEKSINKVALLGTKFTMEGTFYRDVLKERHGIETIIPEDKDRDRIHEIIYRELVLGIINDNSRREYIDIINRLANRGAEGIVLGCTEIPLLIKQEDVDIPVFDTTEIHSKAAARYALE